MSDDDVTFLSVKTFLFERLKKDFLQCGKGLLKAQANESDDKPI